jgi:predicted DNA-binding transcriptional regulator YafY
VSAKRKTPRPATPRTGGRPARPYPQIDRVLDIRDLLWNACPAAVSAHHIAEKVRVSTRTVRRDLAVLERRGEVRRVEDKPTHWRWCSTTENAERRAPSDGEAAARDRLRVAS